MNLSEFHELNEKVDSGDPEAMYDLAKLYLKGAKFSTIIVPKDPKGSKELLLKSGEQGYLPAKALLNDFESDNLIKAVLRELPRAPKIFGKKIEKTCSETYRICGETYRNVTRFLLGSVKATFILLLLIVAGIAIYTLIKGIAALPVSAAIIIGAIIIAVSLKK